MRGVLNDAMIVEIQKDEIFYDAQSGGAYLGRSYVIIDDTKHVWASSGAVPEPGSKVSLFIDPTTDYSIAIKHGTEPNLFQILIKSEIHYQDLMWIKLIIYAALLLGLVIRTTLLFFWTIRPLWDLRFVKRELASNLDHLTRIVINACYITALISLFWLLELGTIQVEQASAIVGSALGVFIVGFYLSPLPIWLVEIVERVRVHKTVKSLAKLLSVIISARTIWAVWILMEDGLQDYLTLMDVIIALGQAWISFI